VGCHANNSVVYLHREMQLGSNIMLLRGLSVVKRKVSCCVLRELDPGNGVRLLDNIINEQEFAEKLETVDFVKRENIMGVLARKIKEEGKVEGKVEVAKSMLYAGSDIQFITKVTGLTEKEVEGLKQQNFQ
jgi:hypothetical protein